MNKEAILYPTMNRNLYGVQLCSVQLLKRQQYLTPPPPQSNFNLLKSALVAVFHSGQRFFSSPTAAGCRYAHCAGSYFKIKKLTLLVASLLISNAIGANMPMQPGAAFEPVGTWSAVVARQVVNEEECRAGQTVQSGESCVYPGTDLEFTVLASGSGRLGFFTSGQRLNIVDSVINGQRITFVANRQGDGSWLIERVGGNVPEPSPPRLESLSLSAGVLKPSFSSEIMRYTAVVGSEVERITLNPIAEDTNHSIAIVANGNSIVGDTVSLNVGDNTIVITVTTADRQANASYTIQLTRQSATSVVNEEECRAGQTVQSGESCVYPGTDLEFTVLASGSGRLGFFTSGQRLNIVDSVINGQRITFVANRQGDGSWLIERVGDNMPMQPGAAFEPVGTWSAVFENIDLQCPLVSDSSELIMDGEYEIKKTPSGLLNIINLSDLSTCMEISRQEANSYTFRCTSSDSDAVYNDTATVVFTSDEEATAAGKLTADFRDYPTIPCSASYMVSLEKTARSSIILDNLSISAGTLRPAFDDRIKHYTATVGSEIGQLTVIPTANYIGQTITINGTVVSRGNNPAIPLVIGENTVSIKVTSADSKASASYTIQLTRQSGTSVVNEEECRAGQTVQSGESCVYPGTDLEFSVLMSGSGRLGFFTSGQRLNIVDSVINGQRITFVANRQGDGSWLIERVGGNVPEPSPPRLESLSLSAGVLKPSFSSETMRYTTVVGSEVERITLNPIAEDTKHSIAIAANGNSIVGNTIPLNVGDNTIVITVTTADRQANASYTIQLTRQSATSVVNEEECRAGQTVQSGESCVYPGTDLEFTVLVSGSGSLGFFTSGQRLNIVDSVINGQRITFVANRQGDGSWLIERVGDSALGNEAGLQVRVRIFLEAPLGTVPAAPLAVRVATDGPVLQLVSRGDGATEQVEVVIYAMNTDEELTMTVSTDEAGAKVVTIPNASIVIAADGNATRRTAQFALTAKRVGMATVTIAVTDGTNNVTVPLRIVVAEPMLQHTVAVIEPQTDTELQLLSRGAEATTQVQVVIDASDTAAELRMTISTDEAGTEVVAVPSAPIVIAADGNAMQRSAEFELEAKGAGVAVVMIAVTDGASTATVALRLIVVSASQLAIISPPPGTELRLLSRGDEVMAQVQVVIDALDTAAELRMTISTDAAGAEVVAIPNPLIIVAADGDAMRRSTQFELTAKTTGTATVTIAVTDGASTATVVLRVVVEPPSPLQILSLSDDTQIALVRGDGSTAATQVEVMLVQPNRGVPIALDLQLASTAGSAVFISTTSLTLTASADGSIRTRFTLAAAEVGTTTLRLVASDRLGNREEVAIRVSVTRVGELCASCMVPDMVTVPAGTFTMGSPSDEPGRDDDEGPQHQVDIGYAFSAGQYALTRGQYRAFVDASGYAADNTWLSPGFTQSDTHPVVRVSWNDANAYLSWLSEQTGEKWRLLSEAEWEYAARAGTTTSYAFGDTINATQARFNSSTGTVAVGSYAANAFALYDMHGNVWEWVEDCWHDNYNEAPTDGSAWLSDCGNADRVLRGGSWFDVPGGLRSAYRGGNDTGSRVSNVGFRVARTLAVADRANVEELPHTIAVIEPQTDTELRLLSRGAEAMAQVQVVIDATDTAADLRMTISTDMAGAEVVTIPSEPIVIAADGNAMRRSAEFELEAKQAGMAIVSITVSDGASTATVVLRVVVESPSPLQILSPSDGTQIVLLRGDGSTAATQVEVMLVQPNRRVPVALDLQLEGIAGSPVFISTTSLTLTASADSSTRTRFTLAAAEVGNTTLRLVASDRLGNREEVAIRVSVTRVGELCASCMVPDMVTVPAGTFTMGSPADEGQGSERPQHSVNISSAFSAGQYALTRGQYRAFVDASGYAAGNAWLNPGITQSDTHPVVNVSWNDANAYLSWLSEQTGEEWRLLSEAEWEYAARAGTTTSYAFGDTINATQARFNSSTGTVAVGSYAANAFALYDMHGNAWEWVEDCWHGDYNEAPTDGSAWLSDCEEDGRVLRGGSWVSGPGFLRSAVRIWGVSGSRNYFDGFRVARTL